MLSLLSWPEWLTFDGFLKLLKDAAVAIWDWFRDLLWSIIGPFYQPISDALDALRGYVTQGLSLLGQFNDYILFVNAWVPVDVFMQLATTYIAYWTVLSTYRLVKSWIPTLSGS